MLTCKCNKDVFFFFVNLPLESHYRELVDSFCSGIQCLSLKLILYGFGDRQNADFRGRRGGEWDFWVWVERECVDDVREEEEELGHGDVLCEAGPGPEGEGDEVGVFPEGPALVEESGGAEGLRVTPVLLAVVDLVEIRHHDRSLRKPEPPELRLSPRRVDHGPREDG